LNCAGLCKAPVFWAFKPVTEGQPGEPCIYKLKTEFNESAGIMGYAMIFTAITSFLVFLFNFGLCCNEEDNAKRKIDRKRYIWDQE